MLPINPDPITQLLQRIQRPTADASRTAPAAPPMLSHPTIGATPPKLQGGVLGALVNAGQSVDSFGRNLVHHPVKTVLDATGVNPLAHGVVNGDYGEAAKGALSLLSLLAPELRGAAPEGAATREALMAAHPEGMDFSINPATLRAEPVLPKTTANGIPLDRGIFARATR